MGLLSTGPNPRSERELAESRGPVRRHENSKEVGEQLLKLLPKLAPLSRQAAVMAARGLVDEASNALSLAYEDRGVPCHNWRHVAGDEFRALRDALVAEMATEMLRLQAGGMTFFEAADAASDTISRKTA